MSRLPAVRTGNASLDRALKTLAQEVETLRRLTDANAKVAGGRTGGTTTTIVREVTGDPDDQVPTLARPPVPVGLEAIGGLRKNALTWANPFRYYENHALTRVYRATENRFDASVEIGQAAYVSYFDDGLAPDQEYWYWIRWENTDSVLGPVSPDEVSATPSENPIVALARVREDLSKDPLVRSLLADIDSPPAVLGEVEAVTGARERLILDAAVRTLEEVSDNSQRLQALESRIEGSLGPEKNIFSAATKAEALAALEAYGAANPAWLAEYDGNANIEVEIRWHEPIGG